MKNPSGGLQPLRSFHPFTALACACLLALGACGGGADDVASSAGALGNDGNRAQALAAGAPAVGTLTLASSNVAGKPRGTSLCALSGDGSKVAFLTIPAQTYVGQYTYVNDVPARVMVRDLNTGALTTLPSDDGVVAHGEVVSFDLAISPNGNKVMFQSSSSSLVPNDTNLQPDVFVRDLVSGSTTLVSSNGQGVAATPIYCCSASYYRQRFVNNDVVSFQQAQQSSLGDTGTFTEDLTSGALRLLMTTVDADNVTFSADGSRLAFSRRDSGFDQRAYLRTVLTGQEQLVSATGNGTPSNGNVVSVILSRDLTSVAFGANATNLLSPAPPVGSSQVYVKTIAATSAL